MDALRLFIALRLSDDVLDRIADWQARVMTGTGVRVLPRDHLHVTLVLLGAQRAENVGVITEGMRNAVSAARRPAFRLHRYRETPRVAMPVLRKDVVGGDACVGRANALTGTIMRTMEARGVYRREHRSSSSPMRASSSRRG